MRKKYEIKPSLIFSVILINLLTISCAKKGSDLISSDDDDDTVATSSSGTSSNNSSSVFEYIFDDESVNNASISYDSDTGILYLDSSGGSNASGAFQGGGTGNKPIAALDGFDGVDLADFSISFDYDQAQDNPWMNLLIDNDNDGIADYIIVPFNPSGGSFSFDGSSDSFKVVCVPSCGTWSSNSYDIDDYPNATIVNSTISDGGMPADSSSTAINGVMFSAGGGSGETGVVSAEISNIQSNLD